MICLNQSGWCSITCSHTSCSLCVCVCVSVSVCVCVCVKPENPVHRQVWLGRGAPKRWFLDSDGFGVGGPWPTACGPSACSPHDTARFVPLRDGGAIAYHVYTNPAERSATYNVTVSRGTTMGMAVITSATEDGDATWYVLRWPYALQEHSVAGDGCRIVRAETANGLVVVEPQIQDASVATSCVVRGRW